MTDNIETSTKPQPCVFLDRDGTLNEEAGYINHPARLKLLPGAAAAVRRLNQAGVLAIVLSNQAGVARGYFTMDVLNKTMTRLRRLLGERNAHLDAIYFAPFHPSSADPQWCEDPNEMRKPGLGMIRKACEEWPVDFENSYMVGDRLNDVKFAHRAGVPGVMVKTGYGLGEVTYESSNWDDQPDFIADDLGGAVAWILRDLRERGVLARRTKKGKSTQ